ncbi:hypothetical protein PAXINDRAFT_16780 [Paxillus involutus ATCC 200175]|uniref:Protein kinase domain-containing protein n=1 Tax=Paxillus involutus ATCC 200175 TaxID=664439 RepID=A0A0C9TR35_PAXIN|nr:hypothetical protein PAXINDRAFT_16780 [Paxillus involutus ATCC 200175]
MSNQPGEPPPAASGIRSFIKKVSQLLHSSLRGLSLRKGKESPRTSIIFAAEQNGTPNLTFSRPLPDVTKHIKKKTLYQYDTIGFTDIYRCVLRKPGEPRKTVAVKVFKVPGIGRSPEVLKMHAQKLRAEVHIWSRLSHPNVSSLFGTADGFSHLPALVSQWAENGTLTQYLEDPGRDISKGKRISILVRVAEALHYIHSEPHHVVHGDLTGSNILINGDGQPLISDFTLSSIFAWRSPLSNFQSCAPASFRWTAPELLEQVEKEPSFESDIYSYGCVMLHTMSGQIPYGKMRDIRVLVEKMDGRRPQIPMHPPIEGRHSYETTTPGVDSPVCPASVATLAISTRSARVGRNERKRKEKRGGEKEMKGDETREDERDERRRRETPRQLPNLPGPPTNPFSAEASERVVMKTELPQSNTTQGRILCGWAFIKASSPSEDHQNG